MGKDKFIVTHRKDRKKGQNSGVAMMSPCYLNREAYAEALATGLIYPAMQPKIVEFPMDDLHPSFVFPAANFN